MTFILSPSYLQVLVVLPPTFCPFLSIGVSYPRSYPRTLLDVALVLNSLFCIVTSENICNVLVYVCVHTEDQACGLMHTPLSDILAIYCLWICTSFLDSL